MYIDYDGTIVQDGVINTSVIKFLYQCVNKGFSIALLTENDGNVEEELRKNRLSELFDQVINIYGERRVTEFISGKNSIYISNAYEHRKAVKDALGIPVFDAHMLECLLEN